MNIYQSRESQKARGKIGMKNTADDPRPRYEKRDSARNQCHKITGKRPTGIAGRAGLFLLVVTRDPQILRGMQHGEQSTAVTSLRNFPSADELDHRRQKKPEELRHRQGKDRKNCPEIAPACQREQGPATGANKKQCQGCPCRKREFSREPQGKNKGIARRPGMEAHYQQNVGSDKRKPKRAAFRFRG